MLVTITDGKWNVHQKSGFLGERILKRFGCKKQSEAGRCDCLFIYLFIYFLFWFLINILIDVGFPYKEIRYYR